MTERSRKTLIGAFVLGAVALLLAAITLVGSGSLFSKNTEFVLFFQASLRGLVPGSPVYFNGIPVGKVRSIQIASSPDDLTFRSPVFIEVEHALFSGSLKGAPDQMESLADPEFVDELVRKGLRARLGTTSFVTGQLSVDLDMVPDAPPINPSEQAPYRGIMQIPTLPSSFDNIMAILTEIPAEEIAEQALKFLTNLNETLEEADIPRLTASITNLAEETQNQVRTLPELRLQVSEALKKFNTVLEGLAQLNVTVLSSVDSSSLQMRKTLEEIASVSKSANNAIKRLDNLLREDSVPMLEFGQTLAAIREAAQAFSGLATLLELQPNALIFGKNTP